METKTAILERHILKQLEALGYREGETVRLRAFHPVKGSRPGINSEFVYPNIPSDLLAKQQADGLGVYLVVNPGGHKDSDIQACRAIFYEHDDMEKDISKSLWQQLGLPEPSLQVDTGGKSVHSYWTLSEPISPADWRELQSALLDFADADRKLKNPSRVMRLAGCRHAQSMEFSRIVGGCEKPYPSAQLKSIIIPSTSAPQKISWAEFNQSFRVPIPDTVPLEICLSKRNRDLLDRGEADGSRSDSAFRLAADLKGVAEWLQVEGQRYTGDPYSLFIEFCQRCPGGGGWQQSEWDQIWKSATSKDRSSVLSPEYLSNCIKGWAWKNCPERDVLKVEDKIQGMPLPRGAVEIQEVPEGATDEEKLRQDIANYIKVADLGTSFQLIPLRNKIAQRHGITKSEIDDLARELERGDGGCLAATSDLLIETFSEIEERASGGVLPGVPCGFYDLDAMTQGFQRSDLIIAAGRPGMGKTSFVLNIARNIAGLQKLPVGIFSLEMSKAQLVYRLLSSEVEIVASRLRTGRIAEHEWEKLGHAISVLASMPIFVDDTPGLRLSELRTKCRRLKAEQGGSLGCVMIDYIQLMSGRGENRVQEIAFISRGLKALARELNCPIIALSQLSRGVESRTNKRPMMSDLRESGQIEQDSDLIMMLYREEYYEPDTPDRGIAEVNIVKHRHGPTGTVKMLFEPEFTRFRNLVAPKN
jgi:replicative DNA helicase